MLLKSDFIEAMNRVLRTSNVNQADLDRIIDVAKRLHELELTRYEAQVFWQWNSDRMDAGWLMADSYSDDEIAADLSAFIDRN